jgi:hypothetical protein
MVVLYRYARLALAVAALLLIVIGAIRAVLGGAALSDVAPFLVIVLVVFAVFGLRYARQTKAITENARFEDLARAAKERMKQREPARILGAECAGCGRSIVVEDDGEHCTRCGAPIHRECAGVHRAADHAEGYR